MNLDMNEEAASPSPAGPVVEPAPSASWWEDYVEIFFAPRGVFRRRIDDPRWIVDVMVLLVLMGILSIGLQAVIEPVLREEFFRAVLAGGEMTMEQADQAWGASGVFRSIGFLAGFPLAVILSGIAIWLVGMAMGSSTSLGSAFVIAALSQFPRIPQQAAIIAQGLVMDLNEVTSIVHLSISPARFMAGSSGDPVVGLMARVDPFILWSTVLVAIGLQLLGRLSRTESYVAASLLYLLGALPIAIGAFLS